MQESWTSGLAAARKETGEAPLAFDRVAALVKAQVEKYSAGRHRGRVPGGDEGWESVADGEAGQGED